MRDYKTSQAVSGRQKLYEEGKLQLPLYMLVARERLDLDPIGGVYYPLAAYKKRHARGIVRRDETEEGGLLAGIPLSTRGGKGDDRVDPDELEEVLAAARERAVEKGSRMRAGLIDRDPLGDRCPKYCEYQPICRLERALGLEEESAEGSGE